MSQGIRRIFLVSLGALLTSAGFLVLLVPVPLPPVGVFMLIAGLTLLSAHSRKARRVIQRSRHRSALLSRAVERFGERAPEYFRRVIRRTRPDAIVRSMRIATVRI
ncbi:MAG: PGPGW domain-containing protein [Rhizomicrobium sp.]